MPPRPAYPLPLSVCMIVRNEAAHLARCLASVTGVAREVIVVDTGSTDETRDIARAAGATVLEVPWEDDFSRARNASLAAATSPWILVLDADEELVAGSVPALARSLDRQDHAQIVDIHLLYPPGVETGPVQVLQVLRLFRNDPRIRFRGRIHENVTASVLALGDTPWRDAGVVVHHHGYVDRGERQRKAARNLVLLEAAYAEDPTEIFMAWKLAQTLPPAEDARRLAVLTRAAEQAFSMPPGDVVTLAFLPQLVARLTVERLRTGLLMAAARGAVQAAERLGATLWFTAGRALAALGDLDGAEAAWQRYLATENRAVHRLVPGDPDASMARARQGMAMIALRRGRVDDALKRLEQALRATAPRGATADDHLAMACDRVRVLFQGGRVQQAVGELTRLGVAVGAVTVNTRGRREVMLVSAEVSEAAGDLAGALPLATAAMDRDTPAPGGDDRAAGLCARLLGSMGPSGWEEALALRPWVRGARYDTLAVRMLLDGHEPVPGETPAATVRALATLHGALAATG